MIPGQYPQVYGLKFGHSKQVWAAMQWEDMHIRLIFEIFKLYKTWKVNLQISFAAERK